MTATKRRINSTGRKRIKRNLVDFRMIETGPGEPLNAQVSLFLKDEGFPDDARVAVEAYHRSSGMRFDCGTIAEPDIPPVLKLDQVDRSGSVLFRVKVIDGQTKLGLLLGSAERIQPRSDESEQGRRSIFPVKTRDLGEEVWKVEVSDGIPPVLILNNRVPGLIQRIAESPLIQSILLPAALRMVLTELVRDPTSDDEDETDWRSDWFKYCRTELQLDEDPAELKDDEDRADWVDEAVRRFCEDADFIAKICSKVEEITP